MCRRRFDGHGPRGTAVPLDFLGEARPGRGDSIVASTTSGALVRFIDREVASRAFRAEIEIVRLLLRITRFAADCRDPVNPI